MRRITTARQLGVLDPWSTAHSCITICIFAPTPLSTSYFKKGSAIPVRHPPPLTHYSARGWIQKERMVISDNIYRSQEALRWPLSEQNDYCTTLLAHELLYCNNGTRFSSFCALSLAQATWRWFQGVEGRELKGIEATGRSAFGWVVRD